MRLFLAIAITDKIRRAYGELLEELRGTAPRAKWVRAENLHVTLKFLGETPAEKLEAAKRALDSARSPEPVQLTFRGLGFFPNEKRPRVFWAGMEASPNLQTLAAEIDRLVHQLGFALEQRPFTPHLTLARFDPPGVRPDLLEAIRARSTQCFGALAAPEFQLIESRLKPAGAEYTTVHTVHFAPGG